MIDVSDKDLTEREAVACGKIVLGEKVYTSLLEGNLPKGDPREAARIAGIIGAKKAHELIPLCHPIILDHISIDFELLPEEFSIEIIAKVKARERTGVEMEALTAVTLAALTIYDMCKSLDKGIVIKDVHLVSKRGGKSGDFFRER
ncbi:MAG: cyclic pyranopterin monophosphate synthase MoaC [Synergistetes bacterium]|nr:cyclic pyranopterin monophosphate synthase MoaC [Synergistota bacterium]MCX8128210.1 cyclic pyranopterin monophosphate synthase MoaC [Synergistota bacterium]MDW8192657.1 cyclic pyranopterin monophosphate synthase MoaC [Synergistota bacterium]